MSILTGSESSRRLLSRPPSFDARLRVFSFDRRGGDSRLEAPPVYRELTDNRMRKVGVLALGSGLALLKVQLTRGNKQRHKGIERF